MKLSGYILFFLPLCALAQINTEMSDSLDVEINYLIAGDSIAHKVITLDEVLLLPKLQFSSKQDQRTYLILRRKTLKVYPYAKLAAERLEALNKRLETLDSKHDQKKYTKQVQEFLENEFAETLKKFTKTEGQILVKLIHRQTGITTFDLIKQLRSGWRAFWFNNTAALFNISLKREFDPITVKEDYLIEDILERSFRNGLLERQAPAVNFNYFDLVDKWVYKNSDN